MIPCLLIALLSLQAVPGGAVVELDDGSNPGLWMAEPSEGVDLSLSSDGAALRLDFDFRGGSGWAAARRPLPLELPANFKLRLALRGSAPPNTLEIKLVEAGADGETVWWARRIGFSPSKDWSVLELKRRHFEFAWGPDPTRSLHRISHLEIAVVAGEGGSGSLWIDELKLIPQEAAPAPLAPPRVSASEGGGSAVFDGDPATCWTIPAGEAWVQASFAAAREFGGLELQWEGDRHYLDYTIEALADGAGWTTLREVRGSNGGRDWLSLPEAEASGLRVRLRQQAAAVGLALCDLRLLPIELGSDSNALFAQVAGSFRRGLFPRYLVGEQSYWTVVGADGGQNELLVGEDGAVESAERSFSIEPFLVVDGGLLTWADAAIEQSLVDGELPIPTVSWQAGLLRLELTVVVEGPAGRARAVLRYRVTNQRCEATVVRLVLALRPFQVNPSRQFLGRPGGVGRIDSIQGSAQDVIVNGERAVVFVTRPLAFGASDFAGGEIIEHLAAGALPQPTRAADAAGWASAAAVFELALPPQGDGDVFVVLPLEPGSDLALSPAWSDDPAGAFAAALLEATIGWQQRLGRTTVELPPEAAELFKTMRANLAYILINRDGPALQPGSRAYDRSWIRDGALTSTALIRLGHADRAKQFVEWFAGYQFPSGRVPCCVDERGADPVPEHDSHGELIYLATEVLRHTDDLDFGRRIWPHVARAAAALEVLRAERRGEAEKSPERLRFWGLLPESISHEGYASRPVHSYWDSFWGVRGLEDAAWMAARLGLDVDARALRNAAREMRREVFASVVRVMNEEGIDFVPGSADLADFDPTSSTVLLDPLGLARWLPPGSLEATFDRYLEGSAERLAGNRPPAVSTPYELRSVGALVRLGRRDEAWRLLQSFLADRRPAGWRQWAEVVDPDPRSPRFIGDMPHTWVGSDFIRSFLDMLAFEDRDRLVLGAGVPAEWARPGDRIRVAGLVTSFGELGYRLQFEEGRMLVEIDALARPPAGGVLLRLPQIGAGTRASINGVVAAVTRGGVLVGDLPAVVVIED